MPLDVLLRFRVRVPRPHACRIPFVFGILSGGFRRFGEHDVESVLVPGGRPRCGAFDAGLRRDHGLRRLSPAEIGFCRRPCGIDRKKRSPFVQGFPETHGREVVVSFLKLPGRRPRFHGNDGSLHTGGRSRFLKPLTSESGRRFHRFAPGSAFFGFHNVFHVRTL